MYIRQVKNGWRVEVERLDVRKSATLPTKAEARAWGVREEAALLATKRGQWPRRSLADAMDRYLVDVSANKSGARAAHTEGLRFQALKNDFPLLAAKVLSEISTADMAQWRDQRLKTVMRSTVQREINLLSNVFQVASREWLWCAGSPFSTLRQPGNQPARDRMISWQEIHAMLRALRYRPGQAPVLKLQEVGYAFALALRTGMRAGELLALTDRNVDLVRRVAVVPHKMQHLTGRPREVPLTPQGVKLMRPLLGREGGRLLQVSSASLSALFRKTREQLGLDGFTFHDSRGTALTHLARKVDVMTLARISGHKDVRTLMEHYYREKAADIASRLHKLR